MKTATFGDPQLPLAPLEAAGPRESLTHLRINVKGLSLVQTLCRPSELLGFRECHVYNMSYFSIIQLINPFHPPLLRCPLSLGRGDVNVLFKTEHLTITSAQHLDQSFSAKKSFLVKAEDLLPYFLLFCTSVCYPEIYNSPFSMWALQKSTTTSRRLPCSLKNRTHFLPPCIFLFL